ncbi:hypothetical protein C1637_03125 [Chryseobacterium lactis]|uniref:Cupin domain-containing protein n=1 Tax=Chryseobacterium lactis TaxID=1241981 RepID=A0A3G6RXP4_CHRLC|nr:hypothetical protein [Chryseobacterium lactis]AZA81578.1 hypothetical protein EG342_06520 [Chryseobacterium lactis]AZB06576.1 hypothetical protein EG341_22640 [Chryseobacterium lactis]PNW15427.1 hypothetical protein C1637_03125 [Chryseobacterium lactis]
MNTEYKNDQNTDAAKKVSTGFVPAVRLMSNLDGSCTFERGKIPTLSHIDVNVFWISSQTEEWEKNIHVAPRKQYVITIKGTVRFKVTDGSTFVIEPGTILLAEDTEGEGHSWDMTDDEEWVRLYIPMAENAYNLFIPDDGMF